MSHKHIQIYGYLIYGILISKERTDYSTYSTGLTVIQIGEKWIELLHNDIQKINSRYIEILNVKGKFLILWNKLWEYIYDVKIRVEFLELDIPKDRGETKRSLKKKIKIFDHIKILYFCDSKVTLKKWKDMSQPRIMYLQMNITDKTLICRIYKEFQCW